MCPWLKSPITVATVYGDLSIIDHYRCPDCCHCLRGPVYYRPPPLSLLLPLFTGTCLLSTTTVVLTVATVYGDLSIIDHYRCPDCCHCLRGPVYYRLPPLSLLLPLFTGTCLLSTTTVVLTVATVYGDLSIIDHHRCPDCCRCLRGPVYYRPPPLF